MHSRPFTGTSALVNGHGTDAPRFANTEMSRRPVTKAGSGVSKSWYWFSEGTAE
jgi:hypothetical protein